jgi:hypothetical protein
MRKEELKKCLEENEAIFGYNGNRAVLLEAWYKIFKDTDPEEFKKAFYEAVKVEEFFIKPAVVIKLIKKNNHLPTDKAWKVCKKLFDKHIKRADLIAIKDRYPVIYSIWEDNKVALNSEKSTKYSGRELFNNLYQEAIYG